MNAMEEKLHRLFLAGGRHYSVTTVRPLIALQRPSTREGPESIVLPPSSVGDHSAVLDPEGPFALGGSRRSTAALTGPVQRDVMHGRGR